MLTVPEISAANSSSAPRADPGWGAASKIAVIADDMNRTRVWAAREARLRDRASASLLMDTATNSRPVSAPARAPTAAAKSRHIAGR